MTRWTYDPNIDAAYIILDDKEPNGVKTVDLTGIGVMVDFDLDGNVLGIELLGGKLRITIDGLVADLHLERFLKEEPNGRDRKVD